ncbi:hypothetical protein EZV61_04860 [Corallincola luteus]|uniref:DUF4303 domain-containing protein n=1 Tax=Corallincola luteus TaxID=1775177 RepID=A0ABY2AST1_9GAMM|nr:hypothetical protein [Corallincola luteus]TCI05292.1 hypothetical protein EZV61_04860 [Corallincola luteus]
MQNNVQNSPLKAQLSALQQQFSEALSAEVAPAFRKIIAHFSAQKIYHIGLEFNAGSWSYCQPFACCEQGLLQGVKQCVAEEGVSDDEMKRSIRWDPGSVSCLPVEEVVRDMLPQLESSLAGINVFLENLDPIYSSPLPDSDSERARSRELQESYYDVIREFHKVLYQTGIDALCHIAALPDIASFLKTSSCVMSLSSYELDEQQFVVDIQRINGKLAAVKVEEDFQVKTRVFGGEPSEEEIKAFIAAHQRT